MFAKCDLSIAGEVCCQCLTQKGNDSRAAARVIEVRRFRVLLLPTFRTVIPPGVKVTRPKGTGGEVALLACTTPPSPRGFWELEILGGLSTCSHVQITYLCLGIVLKVRYLYIYACRPLASCGFDRAPAPLMTPRKKKKKQRICRHLKSQGCCEQGSFALTPL